MNSPMISLGYILLASMFERNLFELFEEAKISNVKKTSVLFYSKIRKKYTIWQVT